MSELKPRHTPQKKVIIHKSRTYERWGGTVTTTLCGRMRNDLRDGMNVGGEVTCKFCLKAEAALAQAKGGE